MAGRIMEDKIEQLYRVDSRRILNKTEFDRSEVGSEAYGETGFESIEMLVSSFREYFKEDSVFYDLGCGTGKIVFHIGLKYCKKKSCGIEFSKERCIMASQIREKFEISGENITIINDNILNCDISDANVIYMDNTLFPVEINRKIYEIIPSGCLILTRNKIRRSQRELKVRIPTSYGTGTIYFEIKE